MKPYIYGKRNLIHIIDLRQTIRGLAIAQRVAVKLARDGKDLIFVGTKRQARNIVKAEAERCDVPYVTERWLGGMLTNFRTVRQRLKRLQELESLEETGEIHQYSKKMISSLNREARKIRRNLEGVRNMGELPGALVIVDPHREHIAVMEARKLNIPTICLADTNCDPDMTDVLIPGNDDAIKAIRILFQIIGDAIDKGKKERAARMGPVTPLQPAAGATPAPAAQPPAEAPAAEAAPAPAPAAEAPQPPPAPADEAPQPAPAPADEAPVEAPAPAAPAEPAAPVEAAPVPAAEPTPQPQPAPAEAPAPASEENSETPPTN